MQLFSSHSCWWRFALIISFFVLTNSLVEGQPVPIGGMLYGENIVKQVENKDGIKNVVTTSNGFYTHFVQRGDYTSFENYEKLWTPPAPRSIRKMHFKNGFWLILLDDGTVHRLGFSFKTGIPVLKTDADLGKVNSGGSEEFDDIGGDALYVHSFSNVYVSRDDGATWQVDNAGLGNLNVRSIAVDTLQYVYAATSAGLYKQHPDTSFWRRATTFPTTNSQFSVFTDRRNRTYVGSDFQGPYYSTDNGTTWTNATGGIGTTQVTGFGDDAYGNVYALASAGLQVWRLTGGVGSWTRIDLPITNQSLDPNLYFVFNSVGGDSTLYAATAFGVYLSTDKGTTWTQSNRGISAENFYAYRQLSNGKKLAATNLGVFSINPNDTAWAKTFPTNGFLRGTLFNDGLGNLYAQGARTTPSSFILPKTVWKSTDKGSTWSQDVQGLSNVPQDGTFYVDDLGGQHISYANNNNATLYFKPAGGSWALDVNGMSLFPVSTGGAFSSDGKGTMYASQGASGPRTGLIWKRPIAGGAWTVDTAGIGLKYVNAMTRDKQGNLYASAYKTGLYRRSNGVWSSLPLPNGTSGSIIDALSVDSTGALFAAFYGTDANFTLRGLGVYYTKDNGTTWKFAGLDSVSANNPNNGIISSVFSLTSYGDSTFASTGRGLFLLRSTAFAQTSLSTKTVTFGNVRVGQFKDTTITITNTGNDLLTITNITSSNALFSARPTTRTLSPNQPYTDTLRFSPSATGSFSANIVVTSNSATSPDTIRVTGTGTTVSSVEKIDGIPKEFSLSQNYPNPFNPSTTIRYSIAKESRVLLEVYNLIGQRVAILVDENQATAFYQVHWNAVGISSGVYTYRLEARPTDRAQAAFVETKKLLLLK